MRIKSEKISTLKDKILMLLQERGYLSFYELRKYFKEIPSHELYNLQKEIPRVGRLILKIHKKNINVLYLKEKDGLIDHRLMVHIARLLPNDFHKTAITKILSEQGLKKDVIYLIYCQKGLILLDDNLVDEALELLNTHIKKLRKLGWNESKIAKKLNIEDDKLLEIKRLKLKRSLRCRPRRRLDLDIEKLKELEKKGLTIREIAKELGVSVSTVYKRLKK